MWQVFRSTLLLQVLLWWLDPAAAVGYPEINPTVTHLMTSASRNDSQLFRDLIVKDGQTVYAAARGTVYKILLDRVVAPPSLALQDKLESKPTFSDETPKRQWWTKDYKKAVYEPFVSVLGNKAQENDLWAEELNMTYKLNNFLDDHILGITKSQRGNTILDAALQYSILYQASNTTFRQHCEEQAMILKTFYGNQLRTPIAKLTELCDIHLKGLVFLDQAKTKLFSIKSGIFGTLPVSATGTGRYEPWVEYELNLHWFLVECVGYSRADKSKCVQPPYWNPPYNSADYDGIITVPDRLGRIEDPYGFVLPSPENYMSKKVHCDYAPAPNRVIMSLNDQSVREDLLSGIASKERCTSTKGFLAQLFIGGYHHDQITMTHVSDRGNGPEGSKKAVYIITEIGQEKQLDLSLEYMNLPEPMPTTSSASIAMVRLIIDENGDVEAGSALVSNPFKYTWVTSPLNRFGRLDKTSSQEQVSYIPKPVAIAEHEDWIYFFFREADWESTPHTPYDIRRQHFQMTSYSHSLYHPWEREFMSRSYMKHQEAGNTHEALYAPTYEGWQYMNKNMRVTGRVSRVCKKDQGIAMGHQDPNLFDLDHGLSLNTFQTFLKTRLICRVATAGTPFIWRLRKDERRLNDSFIDEQSCLTEIQKPDNLYSKDINYRQVSRREIRTELHEHTVTKYAYMSTCRGYKWSYIPKPVTQSAVYVDYPELRSLTQLGDTFYGVFSSPLADEQLHSAKTEHLGNTFAPLIGSALCSFTLEDLKRAFEGPFKKRDKNGVYRPVKPPTNISPSVNGCDSDDDLHRQASKITNMTIEFRDPTQPFDKETRYFDLRDKSERLKFFEEDVTGTRTMWRDIDTLSVLAKSGVVFEKIVSQTFENYHILYVATHIGQIYKVAVWQQDSICTMTNADELKKLYNTSSTMSKLWNNEFYPYINRTLDRKTFSVNFKSDLTMEKNTNFTKDMLLKSDWQCTPKSGSNILTLLKPFGETPTKIWDIEVTSDSLILATDDKVTKLSINQCKRYSHCYTCARDPHCGWQNNSCVTYTNGAIQSVQRPAEEICGCRHIAINVDEADDYILPNLASDSKSIKWLFNDTVLDFNRDVHRRMLTHNASLIVFNIQSEDQGFYEMRDTQTDTCIIRYELNLHECQTEECSYSRVYANWCRRYAEFSEKMMDWENECTDLNSCSRYGG